MPAALLPDTALVGAGEDRAPVETERTVRERVTELSAYLFPREESGEPRRVWLLQEREAQYLGLGPAMRLTKHENFLATTRMYREQLRFNETHSLYQFLPLAHVLARVAQAVALSVGARIIYWTGDPAKIVDFVFVVRTIGIGAAVFSDVNCFGAPNLGNESRAPV